jgi:hypothetical protein
VDVLIESEDAVLDLASENAGTFGSTIVLKDVTVGTPATINDTWAILRASSGAGSDFRITYGDGSDGTDPSYPYDNPIRFKIDSNGDVGVNVSGNPVAKLEVEENDSQGGTSGAALYAHNESTTGGIGVWSETNGTDACMVVDQDGSGPIIKGFRGGGILVFEVRNSGRVVTTALQITGGGDLVEGFDTTDQDCEPGMVMAIDPDHPGQLTVSTSPYDRKVAGVISGAGNIEHGIRMGQDGVLDGETLVAMVGRVYVRCTTENGPIVPGDRLTTSSLRGHAMKATEARGSPGAVIGKAMSGLDEGTGLVLVLVNLQ